MNAKKRDDEADSNQMFALSLRMRLGWARGVALAIAEVHKVDAKCNDWTGFARKEDVEWNVTIAHKDIKMIFAFFLLGWFRDDLFHYSLLSDARISWGGVDV